MMKSQKPRRLRFDISFWVAISAIAVLAAISSVMLLTHFQQQKAQAVEIFVEKGTALIQTFEAALRDRPNIKEDSFPVRKLLMETSQQPDIDYLILTDEKGTILADSDPSMLGQKYGLDLDINNITANREINWRQVANPGGAGTFEVYRSFFPQPYLEAKDMSPPEKSARQKNNLIIYVGFNMAKIEKAGREDTKNTIIIAVILLLVGSLAIVSLFLVQAYRLARTSLSRLTVFSDALVRNMPIGLIALDERGCIASCNEATRGVLNLPCAEALGKIATEVLPPEFSKMFGELSTAGDLLERDIKIRSGQNTEQTWEAVAAVFTDEGVPAGKILLLRDVTAIRQMENEVARSRHLNSIASLAAGVAHEIRNPLSSIKGFAVYFKERLSGNTEDVQTADIMIAEVERLNRVISQLIEFARPLELKKEKINLADLIRHTLKLIAAAVQKNKIQIADKAIDDLPRMEVDPDKIKQVFLNIFLNSVAAMPDGGKLTVEIAPGKENLTVIISDTGTGIKEMDLPRIYDPYFTSKPAGTGLGLAVAQKIMEAHDGNVRVESTVKAGTKAYLSFPLKNNEKDRL
jgi:two-component system sensor histidine kinase HydH